MGGADRAFALASSCQRRDHRTMVSQLRASDEQLLARFDIESPSVLKQFDMLCEETRRSATLTSSLDLLLRLEPTLHLGEDGTVSDRGRPGRPRLNLFHPALRVIRSDGVCLSPNRKCLFEHF